MGAGSHNRLLFARQDERSKRFWPLEIYPLAFLLYAESHSRANLFFAMGKFLRKMPIMHINQLFRVSQPKSFGRFRFSSTLR